MAVIAMVMGGFTGMIAAVTGLFVMDISWTQAAMTYFIAACLTVLLCGAVRFWPVSEEAAEPHTA